MRIACNACGFVFDGEKGATCPRCVAIDLLVPSSRHETPVVGVPHVVPKARAAALAYEPPVDVPPPPVVIPGPASPLSNTLQGTRHELPSPSVELDDFGMGELGRFAAPPTPRAAEEVFSIARMDYMPETIECPRCAETIKARAKACRFCSFELDPEGLAELHAPRREPPAERIVVSPDSPPLPSRPVDDGPRPVRRRSLVRRFFQRKQAEEYVVVPHETKRPPNVCTSCGYRWQPRGHDVSLACPRCRSGGVRRVVQYAPKQDPVIAFVVIAIVVLIFLAIIASHQRSVRQRQPEYFPSGR